MASFFVIRKSKSGKPYGVLVRRPYMSSSRRLYSKAAARNHLELFLVSYDGHYYQQDKEATAKAVTTSALPEDETLEDLDSEEAALLASVGQEAAGLFFIMAIMGVGGDFAPVEHDVALLRANIEERRQAIMKRPADEL